MFVRFLLVFFCMFSFLGQSQIMVTGVVLDQDKEPLVGVSLYLKEAKQGTSTNFEGAFSLKVKIGDVLSVSFLGKKTKQVKITQESRLTIILEDSEELIDEVVITGYKKIKSRVFTGAAPQVKMASIKIEGIQDVSRVLQGRVAGLNIQNVSNTFGTAPRINIRGGASISANVQPLWVIDGAVYEDIVSLTLDQLVSGDAVTLISSAIAGINTNDIEDIQVLKDASATSMYGARALNGVIVITTKSGKRNTKPNVNYSYEQTFRQSPSYTNYNLLNSQETMSIYQEMYRKGYFNEETSLYGRRAGVYYQLFKAMNTYSADKNSFLVENTSDGKLNFLRQKEYNNTNWFSKLFKINPTQNHTITYSSGGENNALYSSFGYYHDAGWSITDKVNRFTANLKNTYYINDKFTTKFTLQGNFRTQKAPGTFARTRNNTTGNFQRDFDINPFVYALNTSRTLSPRDKNGKLEYYRNNWAPFNILNEYDNNYINIDVLDFKALVDLDYKITDELKLSGLLSLRRAVTTNSHYIKKNLM